MSINITTSDYTKTIDALIDGVAFKVRPMNSSEAITLYSLSESMKNAEEGSTDFETASKALGQIEKVFFNLFDKPEKAKKIFSGLEIDAWFEIYNKIVGEKDNG